jgi:peptidoglycan/LPS O-acetylase OafA/YrhL
VLRIALASLALVCLAAANWRLLEGPILYVRPRQLVPVSAINAMHPGGRG